jgi:hypothetical protein
VFGTARGGGCAGSAAVYLAVGQGGQGVEVAGGEFEAGGISDKSQFSRPQQRLRSVLLLVHFTGKALVKQSRDKQVKREVVN